MTVSPGLEIFRRTSSDEGNRRMDVTINVVGRDAAVEELRSLFTWLAGEEEFRGRVRLVEAAPEPGTLGGWPEAVVVELIQGGAVTILASAVIAWIRYRTSKVTCTMTRPDGTSVELTADRIRNTDLAEVGALVEQVAAALGEGDAEGSREGIH
jgi:membrane-associated two-gene conflict system component 1 (EACC1)